MVYHNAAARRRRLLSGASSAGIALAASLGALAPAAAQEGAGPSAQQPVEVITVTGFRASLRAAIDTKREETGVVDAIVADDIADFPDLNLAEAIQRLPGVAIDRDAGEGRQITVRGLNPTFTRVRINGMEALSVTGATDSSGGANRSRSFDFNTFASELFQSVVIRKTQSAEVDEGSLGATVDLRSARPFDYRGFTLAGSAQVGYNDLAEEFNPRLAGLISDQTADGRFGWLFSAAYSNRQLLEEGHSTVRWQNANNFGDCTACSTQAETDTVNNAFHPRIPRYGRLVHDQERLGFTGSLQFRPTPDTEVSLDAMTSSFEATRSEQFIENFSFSRGGSAIPELVGKPAQIVRDYVIDGNNNLIYGVFDNNDVYSEHRFDRIETDFNQISLSVTHDFTDRFRMDGLVGYSESKYDNPVQTTILFTNFDAPGFAYDYRNNDRAPAIDWGFDIDDPSNFVFTEYRDRPNSVTNTYKTAQLNGEFDINEIFTLRGGINFKRYEFDSTEGRRDRQLTPDEWITVTPQMAGQVTGFGSGLGMPSGNATSWITPDIDAVARMVDLYNLPLNPQASEIRSVSEENLGGFAQLAFRTQLGDMPLRGDVGVRHVRTETTSTGILSDSQITVTNEYDDTLPSLNLALEPNDNMVVRFGASQVMARPALGNLTPGGSISGFNYTISYGNPFLDPFRANNFDLGFEWYFDDESLFAAALFYKQIDSFVARETETIPFSQTGVPASAVQVGSPLANDLGAGIDPLVEVTRNVNGAGGDLHGLELQYLRPFTFLPGPFDRFGAVLNYTYVDSDVDYGAAGSNQLTGLSRHSYNATLYYEDERLSARVSLNGREKFLTQFPGRNGNDEEGRNSSLNVDAAVRYALSEQVSLTFDAINLTDEFVDQYVDSANRVSVYHHTGREFLFGVRFRY